MKFGLQCMFEPIKVDEGPKGHAIGQVLYNFIATRLYTFLNIDTIFPNRLFAFPSSWSNLYKWPFQDFGQLAPIRLFGRLASGLG